MGREIVCAECDRPRGVRLGDDPFDVALRMAEKTAAVRGPALRSFVCDACDAPIAAGENAVARSTAPAGMPAPVMAWASEYVGEVSDG